MSASNNKRSTRKPEKTKQSIRRSVVPAKKHTACKNPKDTQTHRSQAMPQTAVSRTTVSWKGPLPPPSVMDGYNNVVPNGADRLFALFEEQTRADCMYQLNEQENAKELRLRSIDSNVYGKIFGTVVTLAAFGGAMYATYINAHYSIPLAFLGLPVLGIIKSIVGGGDSIKDKFFGKIKRKDKDINTKN